jgi:external thioesterase TEII
MKNYLQLDRNLAVRKLKGQSGERTLIFFPFVGGQSLSFKGVSDVLPECWTVWGIDPPGHGWSQGEALNDFDEMIELYYHELSFLWKNDFYLFGHSLGGLIAYRLVQIMEKDSLWPKALFTSAAPLPHRISDYEYLRNRDNRELLEIMREHGGIPEGLTDHREFLNYYMDAIQSDIQSFLGCQIQRSTVIRTPMYVFYSKKDIFLPFEFVYEWDIYGENVRFVEVTGNHLFIQSHAQEVAEKLVEMTD